MHDTATPLVILSISYAFYIAVFFAASSKAALPVFFSSRLVHQCKKIFYLSGLVPNAGGTAAHYRRLRRPPQRQKEPGY